MEYRIVRIREKRTNVEISRLVSFEMGNCPGCLRRKYADLHS